MAHAALERAVHFHVEAVERSGGDTALEPARAALERAAAQAASTGKPRPGTQSTATTAARPPSGGTTLSRQTKAGAAAADTDASAPTEQRRANDGTLGRSQRAR